MAPLRPLAHTEGARGSQHRAHPPLEVHVCHHARDQRPPNHDKHFTFTWRFPLSLLSVRLCVLFLSVCDMCVTCVFRVSQQRHSHVNAVAWWKALRDLIKMYMVCFFFTITELFCLLC